MKALKNTRAWTLYCRQNGFKNLGAGRAARVEGYTVTTLELNPDGSVTGDRAPQPDDIMKTQLKDAFDDIKKEVMPVVPVPVGAGLPPVSTGPDLLALHEYRNAAGELMLCVERLLRPDGVKQCLPWWYYEGEGWQCRDAPDGFLAPLYGNHHNRMRVMIHEGEKAVDAAIAACAPDSTHPWADVLRQYGHCSWKGGAIMGAVGKADWGELDECTEVLIVPDNDREGYEAALRIRGLLQSEAVYCIHWRTFGDIVPKKWDIADPVPSQDGKPLIDEAEFHGAFELYEQATVARFGPDGKPRWELRPEFAKKFSFIVKTGELVENRKPSVYYDAPLFNKAFSRFSRGLRGSLSDAMYSSNDVHKYDRPGYNPGFSIVNDQYIPPPHFGRAKSDGASFVNMYQPPLLRELAPLRRGRWPETVYSLRPFLAYLNKVFTVPQERKTLLRWLCHNLTAGSPEERVHWAVLMISQTEGTGKSTLGNMVKRLIGEHNVSKVEGTTIMDKFNGWMENIQLTIVEEIKEESAFRLSESLKAKISEPTISIRRMNTDNYDTDNFMSLLASSNHMSALSISEKDRRWFVPTVTEDIIPRNPWQARRYLAMPPNEQSNAFFLALWKWFNGGGDRHLLWYLRRYGKALHARGWGEANDRPPDTERKLAVKDRSRGEWQIIVENQLLDEEAVCLQDLSDWFRDQGVKAPRSEVVADFLETIGLVRMYKAEGSPDLKIRQGRIGLLRKAPRGVIYGHIHGRFPDESRKMWNERKRDFHWLSDKFKGLAVADRELSQGPKDETDAF